MSDVKIPVVTGAESPLLSSLNAAPFICWDDGMGNTFLPALKGIH